MSERIEIVTAGGGARSYVQGELMTGGSAVVAYPADYGASGIMTFIVSHEGILFQKDLGEETEKLATAMTVDDPDSSWSTADPGEPEEPAAEGPAEKE